MIAPDCLADLNVIGMDLLKMGHPGLTFDLPTSGNVCCHRPTTV